jgi:hypothetical protein
MNIRSRFFNLTAKAISITPTFFSAINNTLTSTGMNNATNEDSSSKLKDNPLLFVAFLLSVGAIAICTPAAVCAQIYINRIERAQINNHIQLSPQQQAAALATLHKIRSIGCGVALLGLFGVGLVKTFSSSNEPAEKDDYLWHKSSP